MAIAIVSFEIAHPIGVGMAVVSLLLALFVWLRHRRRGLPLIPLLIAAAALGLLLSDLRLVFPGDQAPLVVVIDVSASNHGLLAGDTWSRIRDQVAALTASEDRPSIGVFVDGEVLSTIGAGPGEALRLEDAPPRPRNVFSSRPELAATVVDRAADVRRVILLSDGAIDSDAFSRAFPKAVIYGLESSLPFIYPDPVRIELLDVPSKVAVGSTVVARIGVSGVSRSPLTLRLSGERRAESMEVRLPAGDGTREHLVQLPVSWFAQSGIVRIAAEIVPDGGFDPLPQNNTRAASIVVGDTDPILLVEGTEQPIGGSALAALLGLINPNTRVAHASEVFTSPMALQGIKTLVLNDVPIELLPDRGQSIRDSVAKLGIGLLVTGARTAFGPGGYTGSPLEEALPVTAGPTSDQQRCHVLLLDASASMGLEYRGQPRFSALRDAALSLIDALDERDSVALVPFAARSESDASFVPASAEGKDAMAARLAAVRPAGSTSILGALEAAKRSLSTAPRSDPARPHRVLLISDGETPAEEAPEIASALGTLATLTGSITLILLAEAAPRWVQEARAKLGGNALDVIRVPELARLLASVDDLKRKERASLLRDSPVEGRWVGLPDDVTTPTAPGVAPTATIDGPWTPTALKAQAHSIVRASHPDELPSAVMATWKYGNGHVATAAFDCSDATAALGSPDVQQWLAEAYRWLLSRIPPGEFELSGSAEASGTMLTLSMLDMSQAPPHVTAQVVARPATRSPAESGALLAFERSGPFQWQASLPASSLDDASFAFTLTVAGVTRELGVLTALSPPPSEYFPPYDAPRLLRELIYKSGGLVLPDGARAFPTRLLPHGAEERRVTWALLTLAIGAIGAAVWLRRGARA